MKRILALSFMGLGNLILALPTLEKLREIDPDSHITVLYNRVSVGKLLNLTDYAEEIIFYEPSRSKLRNFIKLLKIFKEKPYDLMVNLYPGFSQHAVIAKLARIPKSIGHKTGITIYQKICEVFYSILLPVIDKKHDLERNLEIIEALVSNLEIEKPELNLKLKKADQIFANGKKWLIEKELGNFNFIAIHPGCHSDMVYKRWSETKFAKLIKLLKDKNYKTLLLAGSGEEELAESINKMEKSDALCLKKELDIVIGILKHASAFIGNDAGLMHLAAALGKPTIGIFGPTDLIRTRPYGELCKYVRIDDLDHEHCYQFDKKRKPIKDCKRDCLENISPEQVLTTLEDLLNKKKS